MPSRRTTILNYLRDTLFPTILTSGGYNFDVGYIARGVQPIDNLPDEKFPVIYIAHGDEERHNINQVAFISDMSVEIYGFVKKSGDTNGLQEDLDKFIRDVSNAIGQDRLFGGSNGVHASSVKSITTDDGDKDPFAAFLMVVDIKYNTEDLNQ